MISLIFVPSFGKETEIPHESFHDRFKRGDLILIQKDKEINYGYFERTYSYPKNPEEIEKDVIILDKSGEEEKVKVLELTEKAKSLRPEIFDEVKKQNLEMSIVDIAFSLDERTLLISYTAENRVDFRELVQNLAKKYGKKIVMLQIGARDQTKRMNLYGPCGVKVCCSNFLKSLPAVSMNAAREQNIAFKGPESLTGVCGKLKCCLNYEAEQYKQLKKQFPAFGASGKIENEYFTVIGMDILNSKIKLKSAERYITLDLEAFNALEDGSFKKSKK